MSTISVGDIQRDPASFLRRLELGETFLVMQDQRAVAEVTPLPIKKSEPRPFGLIAGAFVVPDNFNEPLPEHVLKEFEGE
jgi:antitoxin (DNA-binding transcriptional repressor) of toxin-antitoxin stability system